MTNALTMKLEQFSDFSPEDRRRLDGLAASHRKTWPGKRDIIRDGSHNDQIHLVVSGIAMRNKIMPDGKRQIMAFLIPGDLCDVEVFVLARMDHAITAISETTCALIPADTIKGMLVEMSNLTRALWWSTMTDSAVLRERIIDHGQRNARERLSHLLYEMLIRYRMIGMATDNSYNFPVTQEDLGDATGLTSVHVNRTLQGLRSDGLVEFTGKVVTVKDPVRLKAASRFSPDYLHLRRGDDHDGAAAERVGDLM
jgi:CRP-like cAMP-binding protein